MAKIAGLEAHVAELEALLAAVSRHGDLLTFSGMNVSIVNSEVATRTANGLGNDPRYDQDHTDTACYPFDSDREYHGDGAPDEWTGSRNLVVGDHTYTSYGGLMSGSTIRSPASSRR